MRRFFSSTTAFVAGLVLVAIVGALLIYPSDDYIFLPDEAHPVAPLVTVPGGHDPTVGGIYYVDVIVRKAKLLERLFGGLHEGADLYPASQINPPGGGEAQRRQIDIEDMLNSQQVAAAVALRAAGKKVVTTPIGAKIDAIVERSPSVGKLEADDIITAVDGAPVKTRDDLINAMARHAPGETVSFTIRRANGSRVVRIRTAREPKTGRAIVGIVPETAVDIHLPIDVRINAGDVGGPSAGLAFALDILEELGRNVVHGHKIAATGEILPDGSVGPIGGIKQKTIGARDAHVDAFLVPAGDNARDARRYAHGLRIIAVKSFPQALRALATVR
ncbi:MAG TPA: PDZ domain-containing protein [Gaiellaceae bacterium]|nr:PDZ domain-containing protein [Gaiellaceae bacterium]